MTATEIFEQFINSVQAVDYSKQPISVLLGMRQVFFGYGILLRTIHSLVEHAPPKMVVDILKELEICFADEITKIEMEAGTRGQIPS